MPSATNVDFIVKAALKLSYAGRKYVLETVGVQFPSPA